MGYAGAMMRSPFLDTGLRDDRSQELLPVTSLVFPSKNLNYHENGLSKRGGSTLTITAPSASKIQGGFQFRTYEGASYILFANNGSVFQTDGSHVLKSGHSNTNFISFAQIGVKSGQNTLQKALWADGQILPQYWDGSAGSSSDVSGATSWGGSSGMPFQILNHARNANVRAWAVTKDSMWASKLGDPTDFGDANVVQIPIYTEGGLVGAYELGGQLFAYSKTKTYLIDDTDASSANWGYHESLWEGGAAHWRLICKANNNLYIMAEDGTIYTLQGIIATGAYAAAPLARPAFIDRFIRDEVNLANIENFHCCYDRRLRAIKWFMQSGGSTNNMALIYFIDKKPENAWMIHDNANASSHGYTASCSFEVRNAPSDWQIWTGVYNGDLWKLEQSNRDDGGVSFPVHIKTIRQDFGAPRSWKHFRGLIFRGSASGQVNFTMNIWVDGVRVEDQTFTINGTGAMFDSAHFDVDTFTTDTLVPEMIDVGYYGRDIQFDFINDTAGQDFFLSELLYLLSPRGVRIP